MNIPIQKLAIALIMVMLSTGPSFAKKPDSPGNGAENKSEHQPGPGSSSSNESASHQGFFNDERQARIRSYYSQTRGSGECPPGLAKKDNGCRPPGQAKKWRRGHPLPADVIYYDLPAALIHELGRTPESEKVVRVGTDLLLISVGTGIVIDALEDLDDVF
jgi:Ni/Co efflux regulator RcnB